MLDEPSPLSARTYVSVWLAENQERLGLVRRKFESTESPAKVLSAWFETPRYLVDITVWDHAYCLDILVLEQATGSSVFSEGGSCESTSGLSVRLCSLATWLSAHAAGT